MFSNADLEDAVAAGILSADAAAGLRAFVAQRQAAPAVDEEHFRLISGFNDIFVSIAAALLLVSLWWLGRAIHPALGSAAVATASWGFAEYFTRRRRMALPAIVLLLSFVAGALAFGAQLVHLEWLGNSEPWLPLAAGALLAAIAAYAHWRRFRVPITVAAGAGAVTAMILALVLGLEPGLRSLLYPLLLLAGLAVFALAMRWDMSDRARTTRRSDVAFWLHLLAAPLIIHPAFTMLGLAGPGEATVLRAAAAVTIYFVLASVALAIDRRAVLVSALAYVLYATSSLFRAAGSLTESFALTALTIGAALLLLSAFWQQSRRRVVGLLPPAFRAKLPAA